MRQIRTIQCRYCDENEVKLTSAWANKCACGVEYNGAGQALAPRSQWGEETGETFYEGEE
ncbi:MAG: hypothetical protein K0R18_406 [Bacillales bacterium]|jgi:hypothetical protein|nr:hypothetical protein [Bacillales bacterium]